MGHNYGLSLPISVYICFGSAHDDHYSIMPPIAHGVSRIVVDTQTDATIGLELGIHQ